MVTVKKYETYEDFRKEEFKSLQTFYEDLEDIMEQDLFSHFEEEEEGTSYQKSVRGRRKQYVF